MKYIYAYWKKATPLLVSAFLFVLSFSSAKADDIWGYVISPSGSFIIVYSAEQAYMAGQMIPGAQIITSAAWQAMLAEEAAAGIGATINTAAVAGEAGAAGTLTTIGGVAAPVLVTGVAIVVVGGLWYYEYEWLYDVNGGYPPPWMWVPMSP